MHIYGQTVRVGGGTQSERNGKERPPPTRNV